MEYLFLFVSCGINQIFIQVGGTMGLIDELEKMREEVCALRGFGWLVPSKLYDAKRLPILE